MTDTLLCETVTGPTMADLIAARDRSCADLVELRLDLVDRPDVAGALAGRRRPVIVTCRARWEGGGFDGSEEERRTLLRAALEGGAEWVDVEFRAGFDELVRAGAACVVVSLHDFDAVPTDLDALARAMRQTGAGLIKVAVTPSRLADTLALREIGRAGAAVVIGLGVTGLPTRLLARWYGSCWTYAGDGVMLGQVPAARMLGEFRFHDARDSTVYGVVGNNVTHSLSPAMHNAALAAAGTEAVYVPLPAADFDDFQVFASAIGLAGASVTIPFKVDALRAAAEADRRATTIGASNTLKRDVSGWSATNTDADGFLEPLEVAFEAELAGVRASVLGAGGAARAVVYALREAGARVAVHARGMDAARALADAFGVAARVWPPPAGSWDLLVNTTPLGGAADAEKSPLPGGPFDGRLVYDLTYGRRPSPLLKEAAAAGCRVLGGLPMLVAQAERQFAWWHGRPPPPGVMAAAAERRLAA